MVATRQSLWEPSSKKNKQEQGGSSCNREHNCGTDTERSLWVQEFCKVQGRQGHKTKVHWGLPTKTAKHQKNPQRWKQLETWEYFNRAVPCVLFVLLCRHPLSEIARQNINPNALSLKYNSHHYKSYNISLPEVLQPDSNLLRMTITYFICFLSKWQTTKSYNMPNLLFVDWK